MVRGGGGDKEDNIILSRGEFITEIEGSYDACSFPSLKFVTNKSSLLVSYFNPVCRTFVADYMYAGALGPFGQPGYPGRRFVWKPIDTSGKPMQFLYFSGRS